MDTIIIVASLAVGTVAGWFLRYVKATANKNSAEMKADKIIKEAKSKQQEILLTAKDRALQTMEEVKKEEQQRRQELQHQQSRLEKRESLFDQKLLEIESKKEVIQKKTAEIEVIKKKIMEIKNDQVAKLERIAQINQEKAKELLLEKVEQSTKEALASRIKKLQAESNEVFDEKAKQILTLAIQRCGTSHAEETTSTVLNLPSDDMKGRIIGREGRNIKRIEELTGVEIVVDDTPEAILISGFSPVRRHLAKRTLQRLIEDGRIHPTKIEDAVEAAKKELAADIKKAGEEALFEAGITGIDPKLVQILGRLRYRTSYGQNVLRHSIEVSILAALIAEDIGADVALCRKAGLFHDIGKALDHDVQGTHPKIGRDIGHKFGFDERLSDAAFCHHDDNPPTLEAIIIKVADAISGSRVGARKDSYEQYIQRLEELENVANTFEGIKKCYAIQAGREIRVFVEPAMVDDYGAQQLAQNIAKKIEAELKYPGEIKVNVIRETRVIEYAR